MKDNTTEMILVRDVVIEKVRTRCGITELVFMDMPNETPFYDINNNPASVEIRRELVEGREFINQRGERIIIGFTEAVQKTIGLPMEAFDNQRSDLERVRAERDNLKNDLDTVPEYARMVYKILNLTFWQRLVLLIKYKKSLLKWGIAT